MRNVDDAATKTACTHRNSCPMYGLFDSADQLDYWKQRYCFDEYSRCARYRAMLAGDTPPVQLLPSGRLLKLDY
jgi:hypothetical protein